MHVYRVHVCVGVCSCVCKRGAGACGRKRSMPNAFPLFLDLTFDTGSLTGLQLADYARPDDQGAPLPSCPGKKLEVGKQCWTGP